MNFLIEHEYVILYFSGAFFSFFAMISYIKIGSSLVNGKNKLGTPEEFFDDFENDDLEALLESAFDTVETEDFVEPELSKKNSESLFSEKETGDVVGAGESR